MFVQSKCSCSDCGKSFSSKNPKNCEWCESKRKGICIDEGHDQICVYCGRCKILTTNAKGEEIVYQKNNNENVAITILKPRKTIKNHGDFLEMLEIFKTQEFRLIEKLGGTKNIVIDSKNYANGAENGEMYSFDGRGKTKINLTREFDLTGNGLKVHAKKLYDLGLIRMIEFKFDSVTHFKQKSRTIYFLSRQRLIDYKKEIQDYLNNMYMPKGGFNLPYDQQRVKMLIGRIENILEGW
jgi:hypothetical protein